MAIQQTVTNSFNEELFLAVHDFSTDTFKLALYTSASDIGPQTTVYTTDNEVVAAGYTAGGNAISGVAVLSSGSVSFVSFDNVTWSAALTARGALMYNASKGNKSVLVLDFGADKTSSTTFTVPMPPATATTALLRSSSNP